MSDISDKLSAGEILSTAINVLGKLATPTLMLYSDINNVMKAIKEKTISNQVLKKIKSIKIYSWIF